MLCSKYIFMVLFCFSGKKWEETLERPNLDYSEIFDEDVGQVPGKLAANLKIKKNKIWTLIKFQI